MAKTETENLNKQAVQIHFGKFGVSKTIGGAQTPKRKPRKKQSEGSEGGRGLGLGQKVTFLGPKSHQKVILLIIT